MARKVEDFYYGYNHTPHKITMQQVGVTPAFHGKSSRPLLICVKSYKVMILSAQCFCLVIHSLPYYVCLSFAGALGWSWGVILCSAGFFPYVSSVWVLPFAKDAQMSYSLQREASAVYRGVRKEQELRLDRSMRILSAAMAAVNKKQIWTLLCC